MMHAQEKMANIGPDVLLSLQTSARVGRRNILTIYSDRRVTYQPDPHSGSFQTELETECSSTEAYLQGKLPVDEFLNLKTHYFAIPSDITSGEAANLFVRIGDKEHWVGIWNFGRGDIPPDVDAGMYQAVLQLAETLN